MFTSIQLRKTSGAKSTRKFRSDLLFRYVPLPKLILRAINSGTLYSPVLLESYP
jgi:hypothetical protein